MGDARAFEALERQAELLREYSNHARGRPSSIISDYDPVNSRRVSSMISVCSPVYIAPDIVDALQGAMPTLPDNIPLRHEDLSMPAGFCWFGGRLISVPSHQETDVIDEWVGIMWAEAADGVFIIPIIQKRHKDNRTSVSPIQIGHFTKWAYGEAIDSDAWAMVADEYVKAIDSDAGVGVMNINPDTGEHSVVEVSRDALVANWYVSDILQRQWCYALWHFMQQRCVTRTRLMPNRAQRRRFEGYVEWTEPPTIEVITLRRPEHKETQYRDESPREYNVRWVVSGHWRKQWYPSEEVHKPKWIEAYLKGPEDAPLKNSTKLFAVTR